mmetsp:Transcript_29972/g.42132  ORF Transcript_29972/g.42132 Transcript_29972/m.42132 type:complete len:318 (-) Transcript_29972:798-1751(-)
MLDFRLGVERVLRSCGVAASEGNLHLSNGPLEWVLDEAVSNNQVNSVDTRLSVEVVQVFRVDVGSVSLGRSLHWKDGFELIIGNSDKDLLGSHSLARTRLEVEVEEEVLSRLEGNNIIELLAKGWLVLLASADVIAISRSSDSELGIRNRDGSQDFELSDSRVNTNELARVVARGHAEFQVVESSFRLGSSQAKLVGGIINSSNFLVGEEWLVLFLVSVGLDEGDLRLGSLVAIDVGDSDLDGAFGGGALSEGHNQRSEELVVGNVVQSLQNIVGSFNSVSVLLLNKVFSDSWDFFLSDSLWLGIDCTSQRVDSSPD